MIEHDMDIFNKNIQKETPPEEKKTIDLNLEQEEKNQLNWAEVLDTLQGIRVGKTFIPGDKKKAADLAGTIIVRDFPFKTMFDNEELWFYQEGCYYRGGETRIKDIIQKTPLAETLNINFINEVIDAVRRKTYIERKDFEAPINLICLGNGIYNLSEKKLLPHNRDYYFKSKISINYNENATCPNIEKFFKDIVEEKNEKTLLEIVSYLLYREYFYQKAIMLNGTNDNGKSKYIGLLEMFVGDKNFSSEELQEICHSTFSKAELFGKLMNSCADLPATIMENTGDFKKLTSGTDTISAQRKFGQPFQFKNYAKLIFSANEVPESKDTTDAFFKRWIIIDFPYKFVLGLEEAKDNLKPADPNILNKLTTKEELEGLLLKALLLLPELIERGSFVNNPSVDEVKQRYLLKSNSAVVFIETELVDTVPEENKNDSDYECFVVKDLLWSEYLEFCKFKRTTPKSSTAFHVQIKEKWGAYTEKRTVELGIRRNVWLGVRYLGSWRK